MISSLLMNGQTNFKWEKIDSVQKTKDQIYADTKMFIAETWKSSNSVIQNDDKESGTILVRGNLKTGMILAMAVSEFRYSYDVTFKMKDGRYKISIDNVYCTDSYSPSTSIPKIEPFEGEATNLPKFFNYKPYKKKSEEMMMFIKSELQSIIDSYSKYINKTSLNSNDGW